jgi:hypothetical protein
MLSPTKVLRCLSSQSVLSTDAQGAQAPRVAHLLSALTDVASMPLWWLGGATCLTLRCKTAVYTYYVILL